MDRVLACGASRTIAEALSGASPNFLLDGSAADSVHDGVIFQEKCGFVFHHTEEGVDCPLIGDVRIEHFTYLSREKWSLI